MRELGPEARAIVEAARAEEAPTAADRARVRRALARTLAATGAAAATTATATGAAASATAKATSSLLGFVVKALASAAVIGAVTVGISAGLRSDRSPAGALPAGSVAPGAPAVPADGALDRDAPAEPTVSPAAAAPALEGNEAKPSPTLGVDDTKPSSAPGGMPSQDPRPRAEGVVPEAPAAPGAAPGEDALEVETRQLGEAYRELQSGDAARALALLEEQSAVHARGELGEERAVARVVALCKVGRTLEAKAAADRFLRDHPHSPHADRVRAVCSSPDAP